MNELTKLCYEVREDDVARARNALKASLLFAQDSTHREWPAPWGPPGCRGAGAALAARSRAAACAARPASMQPPAAGGS